MVDVLKKLLLVIGMMAPLAGRIVAEDVPVPVVAKQVILEVNASRLVQLQGAVGPSMIAAAPSIESLSSASQEPIFLALNGPGGYVMVSEIVIQAIELAKTRGVEVKCFTSVMAMSATFNMLSHCTSRYALPDAHLLFHPVKTAVQGAISAPMAAQLFMQLKMIDLTLLAYLIPSLLAGELSPTKIKEIIEDYYAEKMWSAAELAAFAAPGWLTIVDDIQGAPNLLSFQGPDDRLMAKALGLDGETKKEGEDLKIINLGDN